MRLGLEIGVMMAVIGMLGVVVLGQGLGDIAGRASPTPAKLASRPRAATRPVRIWLSMMRLPDWADVADLSDPSRRSWRHRMRSTRRKNDESRDGV